MPLNYIDLHCHTIASKIKNGESTKRNVPNKDYFLNALIDNHVSVVAITNHNYFDFEQYENFKNNDKVLVLPGIEIDIVLLNNSIGHLIFISNDEIKKYNIFLDFISKIKANDFDNACNLKINIKDFPNYIENLDGLIIVHYGSKASAFTAEDVGYLKANCKQNLFVEPSNLISAFIYLNKGMDSIIGSDVKDWNNYPGKPLPELKIGIENFSKLKLLLRKDSKIIEHKTNTKLFASQFKIKNEEYNIDESVALYKDCNIIMGPKSSGKSIFIRAIYDELVSQGFQANINMYSAENVNEQYQKIIEFCPSNSEIDCYSDTENLYKTEIEEIKKFTYPKFINVFDKIKEYIEYTSKTNLAKKLGFISSCTSFILREDEYKDNVKKLKNDYILTNDFKTKEIYKPYLSVDNSEKINCLLDETKNNINKKFIEKFIDFKGTFLANKCINDIKSIFSVLKATSSLPNTTGLKELYEDEKALMRKLNKLFYVLNAKNQRNIKNIGFLDGKGKVSFVKEMDSAYNYTKGKNYKLFKNGFSSKIKEIHRLLVNLNEKKFDITLSENINKILAIFLDNNVESIKDFICYKSYFIRENGSMFEPSKGEQAVLVLSNCINDNNPAIDFYLLDEPEMSVGHSYVNLTIVPRIKELCSLNKCVIVCTHDANIGVGTLPFQVIYREEDSDGQYHTYTGNPFTDVLKDQFENKRSWKETAINVLEGGREALDIREVTYGDKD